MPSKAGPHLHGVPTIHKSAVRREPQGSLGCLFRSLTIRLSTFSSQCEDVLRLAARHNSRDDSLQSSLALWERGGVRGRQQNSLSRVAKRQSSSRRVNGRPPPSCLSRLGWNHGCRLATKVSSLDVGYPRLKMWIATAEANFFEGFDPGSERTLAAWIRHASRTRTSFVAIQSWG
jgi:hypothetical protein